jgi:hypothetical protein
MSFTTTVGDVTFGTAEVLDITATSTQVTVKITGNGGADISSQGVCWNTNNEPTIMDAKTEETLGVHTFTSTLTDLAAATTYYVRSYAINESGTSYGEVKSFTTFDGVIKFSTSIVEEKTATSFQVSYTLTDDGGATVNIQGVCWSTSPKPTSSDNVYQQNYVSGMFTADLTGLQKGKIYYRPYAINAVGITYGEEFSFNIEKPLAIGDTHASGIVFWIDPNDNTKVKVCGDFEVPDNFSWSHANNYCRWSTVGGCGDWRLPSKDELNLMFVNLKAKGLGGFLNGYYWSATERSKNVAWFQDFFSGSQDFEYKTGQFRVRAVRDF